MSKISALMPPLIDEEISFLNSYPTHYTRFIGESCENIIKTFFLQKKINVAQPLIDNGVDILIEKEKNVWSSSQVKKVVIKNKIDHRMMKRNGKEIYRYTYQFSFQGGGSNRKQLKSVDVDYFYHVLITQHRQIIWETPSNVVPLRKDNTFIHCKDVVLDRQFYVRKKSEIDFSKYLLHSHYSQDIFKKFPEFFINSNNNSVIL